MQKILLVLKVLLIYAVYSVFMDLAYALLSSSQHVVFTPEDPSLKDILSTCIIAPIWEEAAYRYAPMTIAKNLGKDFLLPVAVLSSMIFGWGHGYGQLGVIYQGVFGLVLCYTFVKTEYSYPHVVLLHALWNTLSLFYLDHINYI